MIKRISLLRVSVFVFLVGMDRVTKYWAESNLAESLNAEFMSFALHYNSGISFSLMSNLPTISAFTGLLGVVFLGYFCIKIALLRNLYGTIFLWAGVIGNFTDRLLRGHVIDWIYIGIYLNLADVWLCLGCSMLFVKIIKSYRRSQIDLI
ncbi:MAG: signal peptidase II [Synergistaceae bacterium]|jgi:signal peptidase II|nr:signal peptidase II [Synergistaceae bacterium]